MTWSNEDAFVPSRLATARSFVEKMYKSLVQRPVVAHPAIQVAEASF